jgi:addiction module HigA family antidote
MGIKTFKHTGLEQLFCEGRSRRVGAEYRKRVTLILDAIDAATRVADLQGAYGFHQLSGNRAGTYALSVSGNWRLTFRFEDGDKGDILDVDFEDYH